MENQETMKKKVTQVIERFFAEYMSLKPKSVSLVIQSDFILATLHDALSRADHVYAKANASCNLLIIYYQSIFFSSKHLLEEAIDQVYPQCVARSFFSPDPESGRCIVGISLTKNRSQKNANRKAESL